MSKSTGIVLTATGISFGNEWAQTKTPNFRIIVAGMGVALLFNGVERLNERAGVGLAVIMLITTIVTPINGKSAAESVAQLMNIKNPPSGKLVVQRQTGTTTRGPRAI